MTDAELIDLVHKMRVLQKNYFKRKSVTDLVECKRLEKAVDIEIERRESGIGNG